MSEVAAGGLFAPWHGWRLRNTSRAVVESMLRSIGLQDRLFWRIPGEVRGVALTFDDGPDPEMTPRVLDVLGDHGARAAFFLVGERARRYPDLVRQILDEGHLVGNHTYSHARCSELSRDAFWSEVTAGERVIAEISGDPGKLIFRPPYGTTTVPQLLELARSGRRVAMWTHDSYDYRGAPPAEIARLARWAEPGDILLLHERFPATVGGLPGLLRGLEARGLPAVRLESPGRPLSLALLVEGIVESCG
jgi:peptidoglycan-N-acetylglucosamine deacetylase